MVLVRMNELQYQSHVINGGITMKNNKLLTRWARDLYAKREYGILAYDTLPFSLQWRFETDFELFDMYRNIAKRVIQLKRGENNDIA